MKKNIVVIPIYKNEINVFEEISLNQCLRILGTHPIAFVAPQNLNLDKYKSFVGENVDFEFFEDHYFKGINGYNQLMLSQDFYGRFLQYDYMLIYQLDCYVFRDELDYWSSLGYDYIGAPWLFGEFFSLSRCKKAVIYLNNKLDIYHNIDKLSRNDIFLKVGNGGFSLRNINKFYTELGNNRYLNLFLSNDNTSVYNEDVFWSVVAKTIKKPSTKLGCRFSLDPNAALGFEINDFKLPFGCHAWSRDLHFWKEHIPF